MSNAIEFDNVGKQYRLGLVSTGTLSHDLNRWWTMNVLRKDDPYLKIGETNDRAHRGDSEYVWALKDINFSVEQGDVVGIIGKNGAGKSTLLKLLSRVTAPTTGQIRYRGRIASLLEVGTGFHPEMTGRENIYMNGAIMGMTKQEITRKLDEIVDFSGCERYIDTPVKRYSSGMTVRLGFAIAAHLEPEILVVDEVLAVGDAEFQKKAIGKMGEVSSQGGRTVLFVSHNMNSIRRLCRNCIVLKNGELNHIGTADECVDYYQETNVENLQAVWKKELGKVPSNTNKYLEFEEARIINEVEEIGTDEQIIIVLTIRRNYKTLKKCQYSVVFSNSADVPILTYISDFINIPQDKDVYTVKIMLEKHGLPKGKYKVGFNIGVKDYSEVTQHYDTLSCGTLTMEVKYLKKENRIEYLNWTNNACCVLHDKELINVCLL